MTAAARRAPVVGLMVALALTVTATSAGATASGTFVLEGLTLAGTQFGTPSGQPTTVPTDPLLIPVVTGERFLYSTITCASPFPPFNNVGLHFDPDYPGISDPASVRHEFQGMVTHGSGDRGAIQGTITSYLCVGGARADQIVVAFQAEFFPTSATSVPLIGGGPVRTTGGLAFSGGGRIIGGTGRFADLQGGGSLSGQFTCLPGTLQRNGASSCAALGAYSEAPFQLRGDFYDPTA
ncbi:MAG TPA: hypothetical protein VHF27_01965 [Acidimicrobiales bacterium]|nr:hypothetical protein [Acidimicrobiales bacterium]